ncbi:hypothetical protein [Fusobacterium sp. IOR10]|uniref:hypothetical protein n=1 Tax=Fusobacterium sp. IOR10 TaxID=2665157 RepID=UPI0013D839D3|nr:hypothetical protein [Fusobacterium sp. IOR10]
MNKQKGLSVELERSMNLQVHIMTFEEALRNASVIDRLDDKRRIKLYDVLSWNNDMSKSFYKKLLTISEKIRDPIVNQEVLDLLKQMKEFQEKFTVSIGKEKQEDFHYESLDDNLRNYLINYAVQAREKLKIDNSKVETKLILESIERKMRKDD